MINYHEFEKAVYDWMKSKNESNPEFRFATRITAKKGAAKDYFAGTEKSNYFTTTFWEIPVQYPSASVEVISINFSKDKQGRLYYEFKIFMPPGVEGEQEKLALEFARKLSESIISSYPESRLKTPQRSERIDTRVTPVQNGFESVDDLLVELGEEIAPFITLVDKELAIFLKDHDSFRARRIGDEKFQKYQSHLERRLNESDGYMEENVHYWLFSPGENAEKWDEFYDSGVMGLGWDELGDLNQYEDKESIELAIKKIYNTGDNPKNSVLANYDFKYTLKEGDVIICKKGRQVYIGYGIVESDYYYDDTKDSYQKRRRVNWLKKGYWPEEEGNSIVLKTLTDITPWPEYVNSVLELMDFNADSTESKTIEPKLSMNNLNTILYGPPGTGKTFNTINHALSICGKEVEGLERGKVKSVFNQLTSEGRIVFTTFHQSMSYEDFVEGIKPQLQDDGSISYAVEDGIFKNLCNRALTPNYESFDESYVKLLNDLKETEVLDDLKTPTGKTYSISLNSKGNLNLHTGPDRTKHGVLTKSKLINESRGENVSDWQGYYKGVLTYLSEKYGYARNNNSSKSANNNFVIIIDEINRGNVSAIFGELISLIEDDKRIGKKEELKAQLTYSRESFGVPENVYIIGTMNTADRSVEALDTALRRRFSFIETPPNPQLIIEKGKAPGGMVEEFDLAEILSLINRRIEKLIDKDHRIGHSYFLPVDSLETLKVVFKDKLIPLLQEYFFGDYGKIGLVLGSGFVEKQNDSQSNSIFASFDDNYASEFTDREVYHLKDLTKMPYPEFKEALNLLLGK